MNELVAHVPTGVDLIWKLAVSWALHI